MSFYIKQESFQDRFVAAMTKQFVKMDDFALAIALALVSRRNAIFFGPGGHGKSEGMELALNLVADEAEEIFFQSCGEGMTEERLFGGIDLGALDAQKVLQFDAARSFLVSRYAVFEEGLSMPDAAVLSLRDTLTRKQLRNGAQRVDLDTESIFIVTNEEPKKKATLGDSYKALLERFPIQMRVAWPSYSEQDYSELLQTVECRRDCAKPGDLADSLRQAQDLFNTVSVKESRIALSILLQAAGRAGEPISPRAAVMAEEILKAAAAMRGSDKVEAQDLLTLRFLPNFAAIDIEKELRIAKEREETARKEAARREAERYLKQVQAERDLLIQGVRSTEEVDEILEFDTNVRALDLEVEKLGVGSATRSSILRG